jgi:hypothetical protein
LFNRQSVRTVAGTQWRSHGFDTCRTIRTQQAHQGAQTRNWVRSNSAPRSSRRFHRLDDGTHRRRAAAQSYDAPHQRRYGPADARSDEDDCSILREMTMRMTADFLISMQTLQGQSANDNQRGDFEFNVRNMVASELTYTLAHFTRDEGAP